MENCNECEKLEPCGCKAELSALCVKYEGEDTACLGG